MGKSGRAPEGSPYRYLADKLAAVEPEYRAKLYESIERERLKARPKKRRSKGKGRKPLLVSGGAYGLGKSRKH